MYYFSRFLTTHEIGALCTDALMAYSPTHNELDLSRSATLEAVRDRLEVRLGRRLRYFGAFLLLVCDTTIETANGNASEGWHTDGSCALVSGDCFNAWIPLYNSSRSSGLEVITDCDNAWIYEHLGDPASPLEVFVRGSASHIFDRLGASDGTDLLLLRRALRKSLLLEWKALHVARYDAPAAGDLALFRQTEIHRGVHRDGVRIQLSLKFLDERAIDLRSPDAAIVPEKQLSKHGRIEAQLVRELLSLQAKSCASNAEISQWFFKM
ncbi:MAG: hypothetical protein JNN30_20035 [Rhodanobacteraceae bacterium]|nr:hypothetical protein [Rhodanobacteraceae bacterium]